MVATIRTWIPDVNRADDDPDSPGDPADQSAQYSNTVLNFKRFLTGAQPANLTGAWTVERSCDSVTAPDATDQWIDTGDVVFGTDGSQALSWIVLKAPAGFQGSEDAYLLIVCNNDNADANPDKLFMYLSNAAYTGGSTTGRPTTAGQENPLTNNIWLSTAFNPHTTHALRNEVGEFWFFISRDGTNIAETVIGCVRCENGEATAYPAIFFRANSLSQGGNSLTALESIGNWEGWWNTGATSLTNIAQRSPVALPAVSAWANGLSNLGNAAPDGFVDYFNNSATVGLYLGRMVDIRTCPDEVLDGVEQTGDTGAIRRFSLGGFWVPLPSGTVLGL